MVQVNDNPIQKWAEDLNKHLSQDDAHVAAKGMRCSTPPTITEVQIKTTARHLFAPTRTAVLQNNKINPADQYWQRSGGAATLTHCCSGRRVVRPLQEGGRWFLGRSTQTCGVTGKPTAGSRQHRSPRPKAGRRTRPSAATG